MNSIFKGRIGLVDDDEMVRFATRALLKLHQFEVVEFDSAESLLNDSALSTFDCLIVDYRMDGMTGLQLLRELKESSHQVPAIVLSGYTSDAEIQELLSAGANAVMDKPVRTEVLLAELARVTNSEEAA